MERFTVVPPAQIINTSEAKLHLKVDYSADDSIIDICAQMAQDYVESKTNQRIGEQTVNLVIDEFEDQINLDFGPIISVISIKYLDADGEEQTLDPSIYKFLPGFRSIIALRPNCSWPTVYALPRSITIQVKAGWKRNAVQSNGETELPGKLLNVLFLLVTHYYNHRELIYTGLQLSEFPEELTAKGVCDMERRPN